MMDMAFASAGLAIAGSAIAWAAVAAHHFFAIRMLRARTHEMAAQAELMRQANEESIRQIRRSQDALKGRHLRLAEVTPLHPGPAA